MVKWITEIPALRKLAKLAAKYADQDPELAKALEEVQEARRQSEARYQQNLAHNGLDCTECGKRFIPNQYEWSRQCSIGCRANANIAAKVT